MKRFRSFIAFWLLYARRMNRTAREFFAPGSLKPFFLFLGLFATIALALALPVPHPKGPQTQASGQMPGFAAPFTLPSQLKYNANVTGSVSRSIANVLGDVISVKNYGAVCDGVTNDATAMNNAIADANAAGNNKTVVIWANCIGTYTQPVNGVRVLDFRKGSGSGAILNSSAVEVRAYATGGAGTVGSPWTGWDTAITWTGNTYYFFTNGVYAYSTAPNWALTKIRLVGENGEPTLQFNGTGNAVLLDGGAGPGGTGIFDVQLENMTISGNTNATNGIFARALHHSVLRNIRVTNVSAACLRMEWTVVDTVDTFRCTANEGAFNPVPVNCLYLTTRASDGAQASANTFINPICEQVSGTGIKLEGAFQNLFLDGTSETNARGIELITGADRNTFSGTDFETNSVEDGIVNTAYNTFQGVLSTNGLHFGGTAKGNNINGGMYNQITIDAGAKATRLNGVNYSYSAGVLTDNGTDTTISGGLYNITSGTLDAIPWSWRDTIPAVSLTGVGAVEKLDGMSGAWRIPTTGVVLSNTVLTASAPWRVLFVGYWVNNNDGLGMAQTAPIIEATTAAPTITVGSVTVTISKNGSNQLQAATGANTAYFVGRIFVNSYAVAAAAGTAGTASMLLVGSVTAGSFVAGGTTVAAGSNATTLSSTAATTRVGLRNAHTRNITRNSSVAAVDCGGAALNATVTQLLDGAIFTCATAQTLTLPTWQGVSGIVQALPGAPAVGDVIQFTMNSTAAFAFTLAGGTGGTVVGNAVVNNAGRVWTCRLTNVGSGTEAASCY